MDFALWGRQAVLAAHTLVFAIALSAVLREDLRLLRTRHVDVRSIQRTGLTLTRALVALWVTGLWLVAMQVGLDAGAVLDSPKLAAKFLVVSALTANGLALHWLAFPRLAAPTPTSLSSLPLMPVVLGGISTASWLGASFIGVSRVVAPSMRLADYLWLYAALVAGGIATAVLMVRRWPHGR